MTMLDIALAYARRGIPVFPCRGKLPLTKNGFLDATTDEDQIYFWWTEWPDANVGIPTGAASRLWVLDVDPRHGGHTALAKLESQHGPLPDTCTVRTGGGGEHRYFPHVNGESIRNSAGKIGQGLDTRGEGGYVIAAGSVHPETKQRYVYLNKLKPIQAPDWLVALACAPGNDAGPAGPEDPIPEGQRNETLFKLASAMRRRGCSLRVITDALLAENAQRCKPPLSAGEVRAIAQNVVGRYQPENDRNGISVEEAKQRWLVIDLPAEEFLMREIKPREMLLDPILPEQGLVMLYSFRGIGKTFFALGMAAAVAGGGPFLRWKAPRPRKVLYIDGELPQSTLHERLTYVIRGMEQDVPDKTLYIITPDIQEHPMPDISTREGQLRIEPHLEGIDLLILDNLSCLCHAGSENEAESWEPIQDWVLNLRHRGMTVQFLHHAGKGLAQRGTSKREDLLDVALALKHPADYSFEEGLRCEVHFEKIRGLMGEAAKPFEVKMIVDQDKRAIWTIRDVDTTQMEMATQMFAYGMKVGEVAEELKMSRSYAYRLHREWQRTHRQDEQNG